MPVTTRSDPVDFKKALEKDDYFDTISIIPTDYFEKSESYIDKASPALTDDNRDDIKRYAEHSNEAVAGESLQQYIGLNQILSKIPPLSGDTDVIYSVLRVNKDIKPEAGHYVVVNSAPLAFTEDPKEAAKELASPYYDPQAIETVVYRVLSAHQAKSINAATDLPEESATVYGSGSAFEIVEVKTYTVESGHRAGKAFYDITLKEVPRVPYNATILSALEGKKLTIADLTPSSGIPEEIQVKLYDPAVTDPNGEPLLPPEAPDPEHNDDDEPEEDPYIPSSEDEDIPGELE